MSDEAYDAAFCHRFLLPNDRLVHGGLTRCHCGLRPADFKLGPGDLPFSEHVLACKYGATDSGTKAASCPSRATTLS